MNTLQFSLICNEYFINPNLVIEQMINTFSGQNNIPLKIADIINDENKIREFIENNF
jgi:hypothetical protein